MDKKYLILL